MSELAVNKRAFFDYEFSERFVAGIELTGHEAKSVKMGRVNIAGSHAIIRGGEAYLIGVDIPSFQPKNAPKDYESQRTRKLLLKRDEIKYLHGKIHTGLTLVPLKVFVMHGFIKVELGLGRGKKKHDKREAIKKKEVRREIRRIVGKG